MLVSMMIVQPLVLFQLFSVDEVGAHKRFHTHITKLCKKGFNIFYLHKKTYKDFFIKKSFPINHFIFIVYSFLS